MRIICYPEVQFLLSLLLKHTLFDGMIAIITVLIWQKSSNLCWSTIFVSSFFCCVNSLNLNFIYSTHYYFIDETWWDKLEHNHVPRDRMSLLTMCQCILILICLYVSFKNNNNNNNKSLFLMNMEQSVVKKKTETPAML